MLYDSVTVAGGGNLYGR